MTRHTPTLKTRVLKGFTLIELMIAVVIVGILGTIAVSAYSSQMTKSRRTDARTALLDLAAREEKIFSTTNAYATTPYTLGYGTATTATFPITVGSGYYTVSVTAPTTSTFTATATTTGVQVKDTQCTTLTVNQLGQQTSTGTGSAALCWGTGT